MSKLTDKQLETEVAAYLLLAERFHRQMVDIEYHLMVLLDEKETGGHVGDYVWSGDMNARELVRKAKARNTSLRALKAKQ